MNCRVVRFDNITIHVYLTYYLELIANSEVSYLSSELCLSVFEATVLTSK